MCLDHILDIPLEEFVQAEEADLLLVCHKENGC